MSAIVVEPKFDKTWGKNNQFAGLLKVANWLKSKHTDFQYVCYPTLPDFVPDEIYVGSMFTYFYKATWEAVQFYKTKYPNTRTHLGGIYATLCPEHAKGSGADEVMVGQHPQAKQFLPDPSILPYPQDFAYLFSSYGCNRACTYCATHLIYGQGIFQEPVDRVISDIEGLRECGVKEIWFGDDNLLYNSENHLNPICERIIQAEKKPKLGFRVRGGMAAKDLTLETATLMKRAGFKEISFALESTSPAVRQKMGRANNTNLEEFNRALEICDKVGFPRGDIMVYFIIGLPYQTLDDMVDTLAFLLQSGVWAHPQRLTPIPNTVDWKRMGLEQVDYGDLYYKKFVAPTQNNFTHDDLEYIYKLARYFNIGRRYTSGFDFFRDATPVSLKFRDTIAQRCIQEIQPAMVMA